MKANLAAARKPYVNCEQRLRLQESNLLEETGDLECGSVNEPQPSFHRKERRTTGLQEVRGQSLCYGGMLLRPLIIVLDADDIVLAEVASGLDLDELQQNLAGIFQPVHGADRDIDRFVLMHDLDEFVHR